jgi:hypothetical protein
MGQANTEEMGLRMNERTELNSSQTIEFLRAINGTGIKKPKCHFALIQQKPRHPKKGMTLDQYGTFEEFQNWLVEKNLAGFSVFTCVNETNGSGRTVSDMTTARGLWGDYDHGVPVKEAYHELPTFRVHTSPGKAQDHWLLEPGMTFEQHHSCMERLVIDHGCDAAVKNRNRVLRVPGFLTWKYGTPFLVKTEWMSGLYYEPDVIIKAFPPVLKAQVKVEGPPLAFKNVTGVLGRSDGFGEGFDVALVQSAIDALPIEYLRTEPIG